MRRSHDLMIVLGDHHKDTLTTGINLAATYRVNKKYREAEDLYHNTLTIARERYGNQDLIIASVLNNLGMLLKVQRRFAEAISYYNDAVKIRE